MNENDIMHQIMIDLSSNGCLVLRNNTGVFRTMDGSRTVKAGLGKGTSDLVGLCADGVFFAIEVKTKTGRATKDQINFIKAVQQRGGRAGIARDSDEALKIIQA